MFLKIFILFSFLYKLFLFKLAFDSFFNIYKQTSFPNHLYQEIRNTTWKEYFISEKIEKLVKIFPFYINNDKDLDLFVQDSEAKLFWVNNVRGTSKEAKHEKISQNYLYDFVVTNSFYQKASDNQFFILSINQEKNKILKFKKNSVSDFNISIPKWDETVFLDINNNNYPMLKSLSENSKITQINLYELSENEQILLISLQNYYNYNTNLFKIYIKQESIETLNAIKIEKNMLILGAFDMNNDGLIDILYIDNNNNLYVLLNDDPYYYKVFINKINPTKINNMPRLFIFDCNKDNYPDIITADTKKNNIGILFNKGEIYWKNVMEYFKQNKDKSEDLIYKESNWDFIPLIDTKENKIKNKIIDFTIILVEYSKIANFEIFALYENKAYWFIEKDNITNNQYNETNYYNIMNKCDIVIETQENDLNIKYDLILDTDINVDNYPEFILYSSKKNTLYYIQRYEPYLVEFGWQSTFWIYLMIIIYSIASLIGFFEFYNIKKLNDKLTSSKNLLSNEDAKRNEIEFNELINE